MMRKILVETVNEDLSECAKKIDASTLLIWGDNDLEEPVDRAQEHPVQWIRKMPPQNRHGF